MCIFLETCGMIEYLIGGLSDYKTWIMLLADTVETVVFKYLELLICVDLLFMDLNSVFVCIV